MSIDVHEIEAPHHPVADVAWFCLNTSCTMGDSAITSRPIIFQGDAVH